jgi:hypothetical protein
MIQFRRGTTASWRNTKTKLAAGQPGYDKNKHKLKIGDGKAAWAELPYASGLAAQEILDTEKAAKIRSAQDSEDTTLITYGEDVPDENTVGQVYLQVYNTDPEVDYIIKSGINGIWTYHQYKSGITKCWGTITVPTNIQTAIEGTGLFHDDNKMKAIDYPFTFKEPPAETAMIQSPGGIVWLANKGKNTTKASGVYTILSSDEQLATANYSISLQVEGLVKL